MATPDNGIKKVVINQSDLPYLSKNGTYYLRYRVVSGNKTDTSAWSQVYAVTPNSVISILGNSSQTVVPSYKSDGSTINLTWNIPSTLVADNFDIFVNWSTTSDYSSGTSGWIYAATTISNNYQISIPSAYLTSYGSIRYVKFWVQQAVKSSTLTPTTIDSAKLYNPDSYVYSTGPTSLDGGSPFMV